MHVMRALFSPTVVEVRWIISEPIKVTEGERDRIGQLILLELFAQAFGLYATPIEIGVVCAEVIVSGVPPGATISSTNTCHYKSTTLYLVVCSLPWQRL